MPSAIQTWLGISPRPGVERLSVQERWQNITGYSQTSGNFTINQNPGDFASITKNGTALSDVLNLTLNENGITGSHYSSLVLNRYGGDDNSRALLVNSGNAQFNGQVEIGRYDSLPGAIGQGTLIFNTTDNRVYVWNGTVWTAVGSGLASFDAISSGTNTSATMVVGSGASLDFTGTGTINASNLTCTGCIGSTQVAADSLDFAQFKDAMTLDAATNIDTNGLTLSTSGLGALNFASTGSVSFAGNVNAANGIDVEGGSLTVGLTNFEVTPAGEVTRSRKLTIKRSNRNNRVRKWSRTALLRKRQS